MRMIYVLVSCCVIILCIIPVYGNGTIRKKNPGMKSEPISSKILKGGVILDDRGVVAFAPKMALEKDGMHRSVVVLSLFDEKTNLELRPGEVCYSSQGVCVIRPRGCVICPRGSAFRPGV